MSQFKETSTAISDKLLALSNQDRITLLIEKLAACCVSMSPEPHFARLNGSAAKGAFDILLSDAIKIRWPRQAPHDNQKG